MKTLTNGELDILREQEADARADGYENDPIVQAARLVDRLEMAMNDVTEMGERRIGRILLRAQARLERREFAELDKDDPASTLDALWNDGLCPHCCGMGDTPNWGGCGDRAGGYADTCEACSGTGKDLRGCRECGTGHAVQGCPEIRKELMR